MSKQLVYLGLVFFVFISFDSRLFAAKPRALDDQKQVDAAFRKVRQNVMARQIEKAAAKKILDSANLQLGSWQRIGPFRDQGPLLNWMDNVASSFATRFDAEKDALDAGGQAILSKSYPCPNFPATPKAVRKWQEHLEWIDGYYQELPRRAAPSAGESQYLYRQITVDEDVEVKIDFILRAPESDRRMDDPGMEHWRRTGRFRWWVNGKEISRWEGRRDMPQRQTVRLKKGENHFLAKVTNNRHAYGFAFSVYGLHPDLRHERGFEGLWRPLQLDRSSDIPFHSEIETDPLPGWFVKKDNWIDSFIAAYDVIFQMSKSDEVIFANFDGDNFGDWTAAQGEAFGGGPKDDGHRRAAATPMHGKVDRSKPASVLRSNRFKIEKKSILFHVKGRGDDNGARIRIAIVKDASGNEVKDKDVIIYPNVHDKYLWKSVNLDKWLGGEAYIEIIDKKKDRYGHIAVDQIRFSRHEKPVEQNIENIRDCLSRSFTSPKDQRQIRQFIIALNGKGVSHRSIEGNINNFLYRGHEDIKPWLEKKLISYSGINPDKFSTNGQLTGEFVDQALKFVYYRESLERLMALKFHPEPMPGVEHAARDSQGRIVSAMEKELERYPTSQAGDRHTARLHELEKKVKPLLERIISSGDSMVDEVIAAAKELDSMWTQTISELPKLVFLQRPTYRHDALQFTGNGGQPAVIRTFDPKSGSINDVFDLPKSYRAHEINMSWDGKKVFIGGGHKVMSVGVDGKDFKVITSGQSPCEMPDGRVVFFDDDCGQSPCKGSGPRRLLFTCDADGENRKLVSGNLTIDNSPSVMNDGRIMFARWDYGVNKNVFNRHALWMQNPDGTAMDLYFGNTVIDPRGFYRPRQVPGRPEVLSVFGPHHGNVAGLIGLVWNGKGQEGQDGLGFRRLTHDTASVGDRPPEWAFQDAFPLNEQLFLASYGGRYDRKVGLYLLDRSGNRKCILETAGSSGIHSSGIFAARTKPPVIPSRSTNPNWKPNVDLHQRLLSDPDWSQKSTLIMQDVYQGLEPEIKRGQIKYLAVMEQPAQSHKRGGSMGVGTIWYANRCVGLVPVEKDGSAHFQVPALRSLYFHVLDKDGKMLMTQGSDFHTMPGESRSCIGCHEQRKGGAAPPNMGRFPIAAGKAPVRPKMPDWGTNGIIEYEAVVQPVFDKYCISCHSGPVPDGKLDLTGDRTVVYNMSYMQLTDKSLVHFTPGTGATHAQPSNDSDIQAPLSRGSVLSKLTGYLQNPAHSKHKIPFEDQLKVFLWIDSNVPFYSHYRQKSPTVLHGHAVKSLQKVYTKRCGSCHNKPGRPDTKSGLNKYHTWVHQGGRPGQWGVANSGMRVYQMNLTNPGNSATLQAPLSKKAGGWGLCVSADGKSVFENKKDADYKSALNALKEVDRREGLNSTGVKQLLIQSQKKK